MIRIRVRKVGHALLLDQMAYAREHLHQPRDDLVEQALEFIVGGRARLLEGGLALSAPIYPVEHQAVQVNVEIPRRAESLNERDAACVGGGAASCW